MPNSERRRLVSSTGRCIRRSCHFGVKTKASFLKIEVDLLKPARNYPATTRLRIGEPPIAGGCRGTSEVFFLHLRTAAEHLKLLERAHPGEACSGAFRSNFISKSSRRNARRSCQHPLWNRWLPLCLFRHPLPRLCRRPQPCAPSA